MDNGIYTQDHNGIYTVHFDRMNSGQEAFYGKFYDFFANDTVGHINDKTAREQGALWVRRAAEKIFDYKGA